MTDDPEGASVVEAVQESVVEAVDSEAIASIDEEKGAARSVGRDLGKRVGRELGAIIGREIGTIVARDLRERKGIRATLGDVKQRVLELLGSAVRTVDIDSATKRVKDLVESGAPVDLLEDLTGVERSDGEDSGEESTDTESSADEEDQVAGELSADELRDLKEETYRELLEVMSYRDLQSIAKEVGVKANLSEEELTDRVIEQFSEGSDG